MVNLFYGIEPYIIKHEIDSLTKDVDAMNVASFEGLTKEVFELAVQYPFMAEKQVIMVSLKELPTGDEAERCIKALGKVPSFTELILLPQKGVLKNGKLFKYIEQEGRVKECSKVGEMQLFSMCKRLVDSQGSSISDEVLRVFINHIGYLVDEDVTLYTVSTSLKQLCFSSKEITEEDVRALVPESVSAKMWELSDILLNLDGRTLFKKTQILLDEKETVIGMLSFLLRSFRLGYKALLLKGKTPTEISKILGVQSYQIKGVLKYSSRQISTCMDILQGGVIQIKRGVADEKVILITCLSKALNVLQEKQTCQ